MKAKNEHYQKLEFDLKRQSNRLQKLYQEMDEEKNTLFGKIAGLELKISKLEYLAQSQHKESNELSKELNDYRSKDMKQKRLIEIKNNEIARLKRENDNTHTYEVWRQYNDIARFDTMGSMDLYMGQNVMR